MCKGQFGSLSDLLYGTQKAPDRKEISHGTKNIDLSGLNAGCSALSWTTRDGAHLWGRNYDFDRLAEGSSITFLPRETEYFTLLGNESGAEPENACRSRYACAGTGLLLSPHPRAL